MDRTLKNIEVNGIILQNTGDKIIVINSALNDDVTSLFLDFLSDLNENFDLEKDDLAKIPEKNLKNYLEMFSKI